MSDRIRTCPDPAGWIERIVSKASENEDGCWIWSSLLTETGYGRFYPSINGEKRTTGAHRAAWLAFRGDIPGDLQTDHLCRNRACVNPWHLELVSQQINNLRKSNVVQLLAQHDATVCYTCAVSPEADRRSVYSQIAAHLRDRIAAGEFGEENPFPSLSDICSEWSVSVLTARRAVQILDQEGLVLTRPGLPTLVAVAMTVEADTQVAAVLGVQPGALVRVQRMAGTAIFRTL